MEQRIPFSIPAVRYFRGPLLGAGNTFLMTVRQAGLLAPGSSYSLRLPVPSSGTVVLPEAFVPGNSGGSATDSHRLPLRLRFRREIISIPLTGTVKRKIVRPAGHH
jgi:hypothetical protein